MMAEIGKWSRWRPFPDPTKGGFIIAPFGPGCYELRLAGSGKLVRVGRLGRVPDELPASEASGHQEEY